MSFNLNNLPSPLTVDIGCGPNKKPGTLGIDVFAFPEVDIVHNLDFGPTPLPDSSVDEIYCNHVIEHVQNPIAVIAEMHRICKHGAKIHIQTPHFSSLDSWTDMTHLRHLSTQWPLPFLQGGYLSAQTGSFSLISSTVMFPRSALSWMPRLIVCLFGLRRWEKYYAFRYPAGEIQTKLQAIKPGATAAR
jgi:SAM-dependent methyltransferase